MRSLLAVLLGLLVSQPVWAGEFNAIRGPVVQILGDRGSCSAVALSPTRLLTAKHCLENGFDSTFEVQPGGLTARVKYISAITDLALLELKAGKLKHTISVCAREPQIDDRTWLVGYPLGIGNVVTEGLLQGLYDGYYLSTAPGIFGNSGGGLFVKQDGTFCLIGIASYGASAKNQFVFHLLFSVSWGEIKKFLDESTQSRETNPSGNSVSRTR